MWPKSCDTVANIQPQPFPLTAPKTPLRIKLIKTRCGFSYHITDLFSFFAPDYAYLSKKYTLYLHYPGSCLVYEDWQRRGKQWKSMFHQHIVLWHVRELEIGLPSHAIPSLLEIIKSWLGIVHQDIQRGCHTHFCVVWYTKVTVTAYTQKIGHRLNNHHHS